MFKAGNILAGLGYDENAAFMLGLGKTEPGQSYFVTDTRENPRKPLTELSSFKRFDIEETEPGAPAADTGISLLAVKNLSIAKDIFQNRNTDYSEESVKRIVDAYLKGSFNWAAFDPITVWLNPADNKTYILSGHSRTEAFKRLIDMDAIAEGRSFNRIPAKYFTGTIDEAREFALKSNTLSTKETDVERAKYYNQLRANGTPETEIKAEAKENEGRDWNRIYNYSFLNQDGKVIAALVALERGETQSRAQLQSVAAWIGKARATWPELQLSHENELYDWLIVNNAYGTKAGQVSNERDFLTRVATAVNRNTYFGDFKADEPLNIQSKQYLSPIELEHKKAIDEAENDLKEANSLLINKRKDLVRANVSAGEFDRIIKPYNDAVTIATRKVIELKNQTATVSEAAKNQTALFGTRVRLGAISTVAETIAKQIGNKAFVMLGAYNILADGDALSFRFKGSRQFNYLKIKLNHRDLYDLTFCKIVKGKFGIPEVKSEKNFNDIYVDQLHNIIEKTTQLYTSLGAAEIIDGQSTGLNFGGFKPTYKLLADYSHLIAQAKGTNTLTGTGGVMETLDLVQKTIAENIGQTKALALHLYSANVAQYVFNVWHWMKFNLKYNFDPAGKEWVRTPARTFADRLTTGADCEDFTIFASCLFINAGLRPKMLVVAFNGKAQFGHIYPTCNGIIADAVTNNFNRHPDNITKTMEINVLAGVPKGHIAGLGALAPVTPVTEQLIALRAKYLAKLKNGNYKRADLDEYSKLHIAVMANGTPEQPALLAIMPFVQRVNANGHFIFKSKFLNRLYHRPETIDENNVSVADQATLYGLEAAIDQSGAFDDIDCICGLYDEDNLGNAEAFAKIATDRKNSKNDAPQFNTPLPKKVAPTKPKTKIGKALQKIGKAIKKVAPPLVAARAAWLVIVKTNMKKIGHKLAVGYLTEAQAKAKKFDLTKWRKYVDFKNKMEADFKKAGGNPANLRKATLKSKAAKKLGLQGYVEGLGVLDPATGALLTAAIPVVLVVVEGIVKKAGVEGNDLGIDEGFEDSLNTVSLDEADGFTTADQKDIAAKAGEMLDEPGPGGDTPPDTETPWYKTDMALYGGIALGIGAIGYAIFSGGGRKKSSK